MNTSNILGTVTQNKLLTSTGDGPAPSPSPAGSGRLRAGRLPPSCGSARGGGVRAAAPQQGTAGPRRREARAPAVFAATPAQAIAVAALLRDRGGVGPSEPRPPLPEGAAGVAGPGSGAGTFVAGQQEELLVQRGLLLHLPHVLQRQQLVRRGRGGRVRALVQSGHGAGSARPIRARAGRWRGAARPPVPAASPAGAGRRAPARSARGRAERGRAEGERSPLHCAGLMAASPLRGAAGRGRERRRWLCGEAARVRPPESLSAPVAAVCRPSRQRPEGRGQPGPGPAPGRRCEEDFAGFLQESPLSDHRATPPQHDI